MPIEQEFQPQPRRIVIPTLAGVMLAMFLASLDQTVVGTALPRIVADLGGFDRFTWVTTAYLIASTTVVPIVGRLTDMFGRKWFYVAGLVVFLSASALAGLSQSMTQLIMFRAVQGLGGGVIMAITFVAIGDLFPPAERGKYQGLIAGVFGLSAVIGPTLGGFVTDILSWHWIFYINIPLGIPIIFVFLRFFPNIRVTGADHRVDYLGVVFLVLAIVPLLVGLSWGGVQYEWASPQIIGALALATVMTAAFIFRESRAPEPIMPLAIFRNRVVTLSMVAIFLTGFGMFGGIVFIPLFFQIVLGVSATSSGTFMTPMMLGMVVGAALSGQAMSRLGGRYRIQALLGLGTMATGALLISRMSVDTSNTQAIFNIVFMGLGLGVTFPVFTLAVQNAVSYRYMGVATSSTQFFRSVGGTVGLAVLGSLMLHRYSAGATATLPQTVKDAVTPEQLSRITSTPQELASPDSAARLQETLAQLVPQSAGLAEEAMAALRQALAGAIGDVFLVALAAIAVAFVATLFLKELPLKGYQPVDATKERSASLATGD